MRYPTAPTTLALILGVFATMTFAAQSTIPAPSDVAAPPSSAVKTSSGLASRVLKAGTGKAHPGRTDLVTVHYTGWTTDGKMFDSSKIGGGAPATFPLDRVISGWTEGVQLMVEGETRRLWIPEALAYKGQRDPKGMLVFDVELISFRSAPKTPADVKAPPADAKKTASGLAYKVLKAGSGARHPKATDEVTVNYSGWTTDGRMFDSSITSGQQLMVEGETTRFWIPEGLAYRGQRAPYGMLVFDVELISVR
jgi:FKBP-type peptidyl-prolyl cis-trans isomerase